MTTETEDCLARLCERQRIKLQGLQDVKRAAQSLLDYHEGKPGTSGTEDMRVECLRAAIRKSDEER